MLTTATLHLRLASSARPASQFSALHTLASRTTRPAFSSISRPFLTRPQSRQTQLQPIRHASTTTAAAPPPSPAATSAAQPLTWNNFLRLRKIRRYYNLSSSVTLALVSTTLGMSLLAQQNLQTLSAMFFGLDPMVVIGVWTIGFAGAGWLLGPVVGAGVFRAVNRGVVGEMAEKERIFFQRIAKYRVDPSTSSMQNPVPDYYGEKITSVQGYRNWLKDQRAFNKKRTSVV